MFLIYSSTFPHFFLSFFLSPSDSLYVYIFSFLLVLVLLSLSLSLSLSPSLSLAFSLYTFICMWIFIYIFVLILFLFYSSHISKSKSIRNRRFATALSVMSNLKASPFLVPDLMTMGPPLGNNSGFNSLGKLMSSISSYHLCRPPQSFSPYILLYFSLSLTSAFLSLSIYIFFSHIGDACCVSPSSCLLSVPLLCFPNKDNLSPSYFLSVQAILRVRHRILITIVRETIEPMLIIV